MQSLRRCALVWAVLAGVVSDGASAQTLAEPHPGTARIFGRIVGADGQAQVAATRVLAYHLTSGKTFRSAPVKPNGEYEIGELPFGYFDLAVQTAQGLWLTNRVVSLSPAGKAEMILALGAGGAAAGLESGRTWPGEEPGALIGAFEVRQAPRGRDFWRTPKGVALMTGAAAVALLALATSGGDDETTATPVVP